MRKDLSKDEQNDKLDSLLDDFSVTSLRKIKGVHFREVREGGLRLLEPFVWILIFVLLDEPFAGVDPIAVEEIQSIVNSLKERNIGVLITDHNVRETLSITDRSYLLFNGQILKSGTSEFLANDKEAKRLYLGEKFRLD